MLGARHDCRYASATIRCRSWSRHPRIFEEARHTRRATRSDQYARIRFSLPSGALVPWRFGKKRRTFEVHVEGPLIASEPGIAITAAIGGAGLCSCRLRMLPRSLPRVGS